MWRWVIKIVFEVTVLLVLSMIQTVNDFIRSLFTDASGISEHFSQTRGLRSDDHRYSVGVIFISFPGKWLNKCTNKLSLSKLSPILYYHNIATTSREFLDSIFILSKILQYQACDLHFGGIDIAILVHNVRQPIDRIREFCHNSLNYL